MMVFKEQLKGKPPFWGRPPLKKNTPGVEVQVPPFVALDAVPFLGVKGSRIISNMSVSYFRANPKMGKEEKEEKRRRSTSTWGKKEALVHQTLAFSSSRVAEPLARTACRPIRSLVPVARAPFVWASSDFPLTGRRFGLPLLGGFLFGLGRICVRIANRGEECFPFGLLGTEQRKGCRTSKSHPDVPCPHPNAECQC